jgi:hypothetical protein
MSKDTFLGLSAHGRQGEPRQSGLCPRDQFLWHHWGPSLGVQAEGFGDFIRAIVFDGLWNDYQELEGWRTNCRSGACAETGGKEGLRY